MRHYIFSRLALLVIFTSCMPFIQAQETWITNSDVEVYFDEERQYATTAYWYIDLGSNKFVQIDYVLDGRGDSDGFYIYNVDNNWNIASAIVEYCYAGYGTVSTNIPNGKALLVYCMGEDYSGPFDGTIGLYFHVLAKVNAGLSYGYDTAGNRTSRTIILDTSSMTSMQSLQAGAPDIAPVVYEEKVEYSTGIEKKEADIFIYPNPTQGVFAVEIRNLADDISGEVYLIKSNGQLIDKKEAGKDGKVEFDISLEASGTYLVNIHLGNKISSWKIIKK